MAAKIDWQEWRIKYVSGADCVTLEVLSQIPNAPALSTLKKRSALESWTEQRKRFRNEVETQIQRDPVAAATAEKITKIVDLSEMLTRHLQVARLVGSLAVRAIQNTDPTELKPREALEWLKFSIETERLIEGLATERIDVDLSSLSDAELQRLIEGG